MHANHVYCSALPFGVMNTSCDRSAALRACSSSCRFDRILNFHHRCAHHHSFSRACMRSYRHHGHISIFAKTQEGACGDLGASASCLGQVGRTCLEDGDMSQAATSTLQTPGVYLLHLLQWTSIILLHDASCTLRGYNVTLCMPRQTHRMTDLSFMQHLRLGSQHQPKQPPS